jgi:hypothetical protein
MLLESKVYRPQLNAKAIAYWVSGTVIFCGCLALATAIFLQRNERLPQEPLWLLSAFMRIFLFVLCLSAVVSLRSISIFAIKLYQRYADAETRLRCRQTPTCSNYGILAIKKYGAVLGIWKTIQRIRRCSPPGRVDYP